MTQESTAVDRYFIEFHSKLKSYAVSRPLFTKHVRIDTVHTGRRVVETSDALRSALALHLPVACVVLDGNLNSQRSNKGKKEIAIEGKFKHFTYVDVLSQTEKTETFGVRLVVREHPTSNVKYVVVTIYPDRQGEMDLTILPEVRHELWD